MLVESKKVRQDEKEERRRWFSDPDFDLIVWQDRSGTVTNFQLCYDKQTEEHAVIWRTGGTLEHYRVDSGEPGPVKNLAPIMETHPITPHRTLYNEFEMRSSGIDPEIRTCVLSALEEALTSQIKILGEDGPGGVYLLRIHLAKAVNLAFGRFRGGEKLLLEAGEYLYIGSAHGRRGAGTLANRLLRHATRSEPLPPHQIRRHLYSALVDQGLSGKLPTQKTLRWHIDYLLDLPESEVISVIAMRTTRKLEKSLAARLEADPATHPVAPGLGASDHPGHSHLLHFNGDKDWWHQAADWFEL